MTQVVLRRLLQSVPMIFFITVVSFALIKLAPGDPVQSFVNPNMSPDDVERMRRSLGLDKPLYVQYLIWLKNFFTGNFGYSLLNHRPVFTQVVERLPATIGLMGASLLGSLLLAVPLGLVTALYKNRWIDKILSLISYIGISVPSFWFAILLMYIFSIKLNLLPIMGMRTIGVDSVWDVIKHRILPCAVLSFINMSVYMRFIRSNTISQLQEDYVQIQKAYGATQWNIVTRHVLKNVLLPVITLLGMSLPDLIAGAIIIETVFSWPGMGSLGVTAVFGFDYPVIMAITVLSALMLIIGNLLADLCYGLVDSRIKASR